MEWVEIIGVRLFNSVDKDKIRKIFSEVSSTLKASPEQPVRADLFVSNRVETDWSIHLCHKSARRLPEKTRLGLSLAETFRSFGLVNHSVWHR